MNKTELVAAIENGNTEFVSSVEATQWTVHETIYAGRPGCWMADGVEFHSGESAGFFVENSLPELCTVLEQLELEEAAPAE